jgi:CheY-like chemotaxis protein
VLLVDDDPSIGRVVGRMLRGLYELSTVTTGRDALERLARESFDAILCDLMMPEVSGMDVYREAVGRDPAVAARFVFVTGGAFTPVAAEFLQSISNPRVEKPFARATLLGAIQLVTRPGP